MVVILHHRIAILLLLPGMAVASADPGRCEPDGAVVEEGLSTAPASQNWVLEFGPYAGLYDFDRGVYFDDYGLFGMRAAVRARPRLSIEAEFDEVYTRRRVTRNRARQISLAVHARVEPLDHAISPVLFAGPAYVALDDSDDADSFGAAWDLGAGLRWARGARWSLRADWMLRRQDVARHRVSLDGKLVQETDARRVAWGRALRIGMFYAF